MTQLSEDFFLDISEAMRMSEKQSTGNGDEDRKGQPCTARSHAARLYPPLEDSQDNDEHGEKTMQQHFGIGESRPEPDGAERPGLGIASKKEKCREAKKGERPIARPGNFSCLRRERQQSHRENEDARPVMVVLRPGLFRGSVRACSGLPGNVGFRGERPYFESFFLRLISVLGQLLHGSAGKSWRLRRHAGNNFGAGDAVVNEIRSGRKRRKGSGGENHRDADAKFGFTEALQAGKDGAGRSAAHQLKIERAEKQQKAEEQRFGGDHRAVGSSVYRF